MKSKLRYIADRLRIQAQHYRQKANETDDNTLHGMADTFERYANLFDPTHPRIHTPELTTTIILIVITIHFIF